jgi:hypothetical protein
MARLLQQFYFVPHIANLFLMPQSLARHRRFLYLTFSYFLRQFPKPMFQTHHVRLGLRAQSESYTFRPLSMAFMNVWYSSQWNMVSALSHNFVMLRAHN